MHGHAYHLQPCICIWYEYRHACPCVRANARLHWVEVARMLRVATRMGLRLFRNMCRTNSLQNINLQHDFVCLYILNLDRHFRKLRKQILKLGLKRLHESGCLSNFLFVFEFPRVPIFVCRLKCFAIPISNLQSTERENTLVSIFPCSLRALCASTHTQIYIRVLV